MCEVLFDLKVVLMLNIYSLKKFPFAEKYLFSSEGLNLKSFSKHIQKVVLSEMTIDDVIFIDKICKWKELVIRGNDIPCPIDKIDFQQRNVTRSKLSLVWKIAERICSLIFFSTLIIIGFFIWGDLDIKYDYHIFIILAIIVVIALIARMVIHIKLIRNVRMLEQLFPFATVNCEIASKSFAHSLYTSFFDVYYDRYNQYFYPDISYFIRLNVYIEVYYTLLKYAISSYPDKILTYYKYGENRFAVYEYKTEHKFGILRSYTENVICGYKNIFDILKGIKETQNQQFLSSIISRSKVENVYDLRLSTELVEYFNLRKDYLLCEGGFESHTNKWVDKPIYKDNEAYKFRIDKYFRKYTIVLSIVSTILLGFYPAYFRYHYVRNRLAENEYKILREDCGANYDRLYSLEAVDLKVTVKNKKISNNHVGDSWEYFNWVNGTEIKKKATISYHYGEPIILSTKIVEQDKIDDVSYNEKKMNLSIDELKKGVDISIDSYVYENRGKYSGCHAKWRSKYHIEVVNPNKPVYQNIEVPTTEVLKNFFKSF